MKKYMKYLVAMFMAVICSSCLESGLEELDVYEGNDITSVAVVYHRYYTSDIQNASGEQSVRQTSMRIVSQSCNAESAICDLTVADPSNLPAAEKGKVSASNLVVVVNISTAAIISPVDGSPKLGVPGDWSKPNKYIITAANGEKKEWTINLTYQTAEQ